MFEHNDLPSSKSHVRRVVGMPGDTIYMRDYVLYLKANKKVGKYYVFDNVCEEFYNKHFDLEQLEVINGLTCILQTR